MNHNEKKELRSQFAKVKGLGASGNGTAVWWAQRVTAVALIPLVVWFAFFIIEIVEYRSMSEMTAVFTSPFMTMFLTLFIAIGLYHGFLGIKEIIEDYVHCHVMKIGMILFIQFFTIITALAGICAILAFHFAIFDYY